MKILFIVLLLAAGTGYAQSSLTLYFDADSKVTVPANALYHSVITRQPTDTSLYAVETYYQPGERMLSGNYQALTGAVDWSKLYQSDFGGALKEGLHQEFYPGGKLWREVFYHKGLPQGKAKSYYERGGLLSEYDNWQGKPEGEYEEYYESGKLKIKTKFKEGQIAGEVDRYDEEGNVLPE